MFQPCLFGDYIVVDRIAVGGMAEIFKARRIDAETEDWVVLKRLLPHLAKDHQMVQMFMHEAEIASRIKHPNIVPALDWGQIDSDCYLTQSFVQGVDLQTVLKVIKRNVSQLSLQHFVYIFKSVCAGLNACHTLADRNGDPLNLVHRDVTPENILLCFDGRILLTDFGIASSRLIQPTTKHGAPKGKTRYLSPEQARLETLDGRSDLYSLAAVMYEVINGEPLFDGPNQFVILDAIRKGVGLPVSQTLHTDFPPRLVSLIAGALAYDPADRPANAAELMNALGQFSNTAEDLIKADLALWLQSQFSQKIMDAEELNERHIRLDILDGEIIEHAPPRTDKTGTFSTEIASIGQSRLKTSISHIQQSDSSGHPLTVETRAAVLAGSPLLESTSTPTPGETLDVSHPFTQITDASEQAPIETQNKNPLIHLMLLVILASLGAAMASLVVNYLKDQDTGLMLVQTVPSQDLSISLNGKVVADRSPLAIKHLSPGEYTVELKDSEGRRELFKSTVTAGQVARFSGSLGPNAANQAGLIIEPIPSDALVRIDNKSVGGDQPFSTSIGQTHSLEVSKPGYLPARRNLKIKRGGQRVIKVRLKPIEGTLFVDSTPNGTVYINGHRRGRTPLQLNAVDVNERWTVKIEAPNRKPYQKTVTFGSTQTLQIDEVLAPLD
ncbi:MAG: serine/threonine-protein kinase [Myxococcota bacterium]|nr:serine/threonine-protein kinase [Myxococcota bacterium]